MEVLHTATDERQHTVLTHRQQLLLKQAQGRMAVMKLLKVQQQERDAARKILKVQQDRKMQQILKVQQQERRNDASKEAELDAEEAELDATRACADYHSALAERLFDLGMQEELVGLIHKKNAKKNIKPSKQTKPSQAVAWLLKHKLAKMMVPLLTASGADLDDLDTGRSDGLKTMDDVMAIPGMLRPHLAKRFLRARAHDPLRTRKPLLDQTNDQGQRDESPRPQGQQCAMVSPFTCRLHLRAARAPRCVYPATALQRAQLPVRSPRAPSSMRLPRV